jgi:hypothetical protein
MQCRAEATTLAAKHGHPITTRNYGFARERGHSNNMSWHPAPWTSKLSAVADSATATSIFLRLLAARRKLYWPLRNPLTSQKERQPARSGCRRVAAAFAVGLKRTLPEWFGNCDVTQSRSVELIFCLKLDGLRIMAGQNWLILHNTPAVSAHQKRAARVFRFEYSEYFLAVQRIRSPDASM